MPGPFDVELIGEVKRKSEPFAYQLIHDGAVINPANRSALASAIIKQFLASFLDRGYVDSGDAKQFFCEQKIRQRLLVAGIDLHKNDILRILIAKDGAPQQLLVSLPVQSAQQVLEVFVEVKDLHVDLRKHGLVRVERREAL